MNIENPIRDENGATKAFEKITNQELRKAVEHLYDFLNKEPASPRITAAPFPSPAPAVPQRAEEWSYNRQTGIWRHIDPASGRTSYPSQEYVPDDEMARYGLKREGQ